ncbi:MAG: bifunctional YncE family protein/alkaline phosphatase family protein [Fimbriimonas sp.]|nr:bifunctional YncE family protein/alkaline phosphatase family protein [Fimbriimonas sp.]
MASTSRRKPVLPNLTSLDGATLLPNGWKVTPAGRSIDLAGDMPLKMAFSNDGSRLFVVTAGWHNQGITSIDTANGLAEGFTDLGNAWAGLAVGANRIFVSGGAMPVRSLQVEPTLARLEDIQATLEAPKANGRKRATGQFVAGLALADGDLFAVDTSADSIAKLAGPSFKEISSLKVGYRPFGIAASPDGKVLAVSNWGDQSVSLIDAAHLVETQRVPVGSHPNELVWSPDGRLFVANAGSDDVTVIRDGKAIETIKTRLSPRDSMGSTPDALAISPDSKTLYVANADNNDVAVIDVSHATSIVTGFIPTGWYPSALAVSPDGKKLYIGTGKGLKFDANAPAQTKFVRTEYDGKKKYDYIGGVLSGHVNVVDIPDESRLSRYTRQVTSNMPTAAAGGISPTQQETAVHGILRKIKHVVYVIRENRTYDQVFGDLPKGNNDPNLVLFGKEVTPNAHALATRFVQLDNLYCNGEVSEDGHQWCDSAYCTDFTEKAWVNSYSGRGEPAADERLTASPAGYLWDDCRVHHVSYYTYGEFSSFKSDPNSPPVFTGVKGLEGHASLAWAQAGREAGLDRDYKKAKVFIDDLHHAEKANDWPSFMVMSLGEDHTSGLRAGSYTPQASVASNDLGLAEMIDAVSHSKFWKDTAFFVIEDDAQNGPDHVDAHRTVGLIISPYIKRGTLDSTQYTTASFVRTIELILGLPPMTQFDQKATPIIAPFTPKPNLTPYTALSETVALESRNGENTALAQESAELDWSAFDRADPDKLNEILWKAIKPGKAMPSPTRSAHIVR